MKRHKLCYYNNMCKRDLVSVIIPVYNRENLVSGAIDSVLQQTYPHWEIIIADDGSTDNTKAVLNQYAAHRAISILSLDHCGKPGQVRNSAVKHSKGRWISFLDSDDSWKSDKLEKQIEYLRAHQNYRFIHTLERWERNDKIVSQAHRKHNKEGDLFKTSLGKCEIGPSTVMMDRELYRQNDGFRNDLEICEDYEFWLRITSDNPVAYLDEELVVKRGGHSDQLSMKYGFIEIFKIEALKDLVDKGFFKSDHMLLAKKELARKCRIYSLGCRKRGKESEAQKFEALFFFYSGDDIIG